MSLENKWFDLLVIINEWNIEGRYLDYKLKIYNRANDEYVLEHSEKIKILIDLIKSSIT